MLRPGGRLAALAIVVAAGAGDEEIAHAQDVGPDFAGAGDGYRALASEAGFEDVEIVDVTASYARTVDAWGAAWERRSAEVIELVGEEEFAERQSRRRGTATAIAEGLIVRQLLVARVSQAVRVKSKL